MGLFQYALEGEDRSDRIRGEISEDSGTTWKTLFDRPVEFFRHRWHFGCDGETDCSQPLQSVLVRLCARTGLKEIKVRAHYTDSRADGFNVPLYITHIWKEGSQERSHTEEINPCENKNYEIACGSDPENIGIIMEAKSLNVT